MPPTIHEHARAVARNIAKLMDSTSDGSRETRTAVVVMELVGFITQWADLVPHDGGLNPSLAIGFAIGELVRDANKTPAEPA